MELKDYFEVLLRRRLVIGITFVLAIAAAAAITYVMTPIYQGSAMLRITPPVIGTIDYSELVYAERATNTYIKILTSWPIRDAVASRLGISQEGLDKRIKIEAIRDTELIRILVEDPDKEQAKRITSTMVDLAMELNQRPSGGRSPQAMLAEQLTSIQNELGNARLALSAAQTGTAGQVDVASAAGKVRILEEIYGTLLREYEQSRLRETVQANSITIVEPAEASKLPVKPNRTQNIGLGALLGLLAGIGLAFLAEALDKAVRTTEDLEQVIQTGVLGTVPRLQVKNGVPEIVIAKPLAKHALESFRLLRANLQSSSGENPTRTLLFTSASPSEGKSTIVANLAAVMAQANQRVAVVDADFRRPCFHKIFDLRNQKGLSQALLREELVSSLLQPTRFGNLKVLTSGPLPPSPDAALDPRSVEEVLKELLRMFDLVLVDGPPSLLMADVSLIAPLFDGVVVVARSGRTTTRDLRSVIAQLQGVNANIVGTVLNSFNTDRSDHYYREYFRPNSSKAVKS
ncbi:MAG: polysaccharide biosynthesis tyrosine autokinase [Chloroflexi bacterium]|nr:polysaccharide biosynthesis tyrosine autokinase [Chloroflexota bacterium]